MMKIAVPAADGMLCAHFGHCECFMVFEVDDEKKEILKEESLDPPAHEPGVFPRWLSGEGVDLVIAGGMGARAQELFRASGVSVVVGALGKAPLDIVKAYLGGSLVSGANLCDH